MPKPDEPHLASGHFRHLCPPDFPTVHPQNPSSNVAAAPRRPHCNPRLSVAGQNSRMPANFQALGTPKERA